MRYIATASITLPVVASFSDDGVHPLDEQAEEALKVEAIMGLCLKWDEEIQLDNMQTTPARD